MKKVISILLLMCICMVGCKAETENVYDGTTDVSTTVSETTVTTTTEAVTVSETTVATTTEATTAPETTVTTTTEAVTASETTVATTTEATTVPETTVVTTTETTTAPETTVATTTEATTVSETTVTEMETTTEETIVEEHNVIEIEGKRYKLTFEDNFDGDELDLEKWERCPEWKRQDLNNYWDNDMSYLDGDGNLIIEMSYDEERDSYLSGAVRTKGKFEQAYGYYEIRCRVNTVAGYWTAFWLMGETVGGTQDGGVDGTEIDIMESAYYGTGEINHGLHWDGYEFFHKSDGKRVAADVYDGEYHTFAVLWTDKEYVFFADGKETWRTDAKAAKGTCKNPLYIKVTSETGSWTGTELKKESLPDYMKIDYVRAYAAE